MMKNDVSFKNRSDSYWTMGFNVFTVASMVIDETQSSEAPILGKKSHEWKHSRSLCESACFYQ